MAFIAVADVKSDKGWVAANPTTILDFSAVAYFFARDLYEKYTKEVISEMNGRRRGKHRQPSGAWKVGRRGESWLAVASNY